MDESINLISDTVLVSPLSLVSRSPCLSEACLKSSDTDKYSQATSLCSQTSIFSQESLSLSNQTSIVSQSLSNQTSIVSQESLSLSNQTSIVSQESLSLSIQTSIFSQESSSLSNQTSIFSQESLSLENLQPELSLDQSTLSEQTQSSEISSVLSIGTCQRKGIEGCSYKCIKTLQGQNDRIFSLYLTQTSLYSGTEGSDIKEWRLSDLCEVAKFGSGDGAVNALLIVEDKIFTAHQDQKIRVWTRSHGEINSRHKLVATIPTVKNILVACLPPKNYVSVRRHKKCLWITHSDTISVLAKGPSNLIYSGSWDKTFKVWRLCDFRCIESISAHDDAINALVVSSKGHVYTASADAKIKIWERNCNKHSLVATLVRHKSAVNALALSKNDLLLYSGSSDRSIMVWEREESAEHMVMLGTLKGHRGAVLCLSTMATFLCSGSADKTIRLWKRAPDNTHSCLVVLEGHAGPVKSVCLRSGNDLCGTVVYSGSLDKQIKVWLLSLTSSDDSISDFETQTNS